MNDVWGSKGWFEQQFSDIKDERVGDRWGHRWRGSQKYRYDIYIDILKKILPAKKKMRILDIGCALGDFTERVRNLDFKNEICGIDISEKAIKRISREFPKNGPQNAKFGVGSLPLLPFGERSFDLVLCLEVLYYLNEEDRKKSLIDIKRVLKPEGYLLLSGVLDGGIRYFAEDKIVTLVSGHFYIEAIEYNYTKIYTIIETKFLFLLDTCEMVKKSLIKSDDEFLEWCKETKDEQKIKIMKKVKKIFYIIPFNKRIGKVIYVFSKKTIRALISLKFPVVIFSKLTRFLLRNKGKTNIIILARKQQ